jgi:hypothetical protein
LTLPSGVRTATALIGPAREPADDRTLPSIMDAISRGSREAFVLLFDRTAGAIGVELTACSADTEPRAAILAATYVEVWWLAGCRSSTDRDVQQWISRILHRRAMAVHRAVSSPAGWEQRPSRAELELAILLGRPVDRLWTTRTPSPAEVIGR